MKRDDAKEKIKERYENVAQQHDNDNEWLEKGNSFRVPEKAAAYYFIDRKISEALKFCEITENKTALEIGCSFGNMTGLLAAKFKHLSATDISGKSVNIAEKRLKHYGINNVKYFVDDAETLEHVKENSYDYIFSFSTIRFCQNREQAIKKYLKNLNREARPLLISPINILHGIGL